MSCTEPEHVWSGGMALEHLCLASVQVDLCSFLLCWLIHLAVGEGWRQKRNFLLENPSPVNGWDSPALSHTHTPQRHLENGRGPLPMTVLNQGSTCGPGATCTAQVGWAVRGLPDPLFISASTCWTSSSHSRQCPWSTTKSLNQMCSHCQAELRW